MTKKSSNVQMLKCSKLSEEEVVHVAKLAGLTLTRQEVKKFQKQLSEVLNYVEILKRIRTNKVSPTSQVTGLENVSREDKTGLSLSQKEVLANVKSTYKGYFRTKAIFD